MTDNNSLPELSESLRIRRERRDCRNALMKAMSSKLGLSARQIATTFMVDNSGSSFFVPGESQCPSGLAEMAKEYIEKWRGTDPGFLIRRLVVREGANPNNPLLVPDVEGVISGKYDEKRAADPRLVANRDKEDGRDEGPEENVAEQSRSDDELAREWVEVALVDDFATAALTGLVSAIDKNAVSQEGWTDSLAKGAYAIAKAMIRERRKVVVS